MCGDVFEYPALRISRGKINRRALGRVNERNQFWSASRMNFISASMTGCARGRMTNRARVSILGLRNSAAQWIYTNYLNVPANRRPAPGYVMIALMIDHPVRWFIDSARNRDLASRHSRLLPDGVFSLSLSYFLLYIYLRKYIIQQLFSVPSFEWRFTIFKSPDSTWLRTWLAAYKRRLVSAYLCYMRF